MKTVQLLKRNLTYYWRTNLSVLFGVAAAVAVLAGALLVGDSVRASLRDLFVQRLGETDYRISGTSFFRTQLASDLEQHKQFKEHGFVAANALIALRGTVVHEKSRRQGGEIMVYGIDETFWRFHHTDQAIKTPESRDVLVGEGLARELGAAPGDSLILRIEKPSDIPLESLHGRKEDAGRTLRLTVTGTVPASSLGEFSLQPQQGMVRVVFVSLRSLQKELEQEGKVNTLLVSAATKAESRSPNQLADLKKILNDSAKLEDFGITLRLLEAKGELSVETESKLINEELADAAASAATTASLRTTSSLAYLANRISVGDRSVPYSLIAAVDNSAFLELKDLAGEAEPKSAGRDVAENGKGGPLSRSPILLNEWTTRDLGARVGDEISLEYYLWHEGGRLETRTAQFQLAGIVPIKGLAADRELVPDYPGITETEHLADWDPPFPIDLTRVRSQDEDYWKQFRTTPKGFIPLQAGQELWQSRFGKLTSIRVGPESSTDLLTSYGQSLRTGLDPERMGLVPVPIRSQGVEASRGATDFGEYFFYFSFFLVISALLLTVLFFKLGVEQRLREIGTLEAIGFPPAKIRNLFIAEGFIVAVIGTLVGLAGSILYGSLLMYGLRTWWVDAVGTTMLKLRVNPFSLILGGLAGVLVAVICIVLTLRRLDRVSTRSLLMRTAEMMASEKSKQVGGSSPVRRRWWQHLISVARLALITTISGIGFLLATLLGLVGQAAGFFGGGALLLVGLLCYQFGWLKRGKGKPIGGTGWWPVSRLGFRNSTYNPGRSILCIALIAAAAFIIVSVDAFRRDYGTDADSKMSGSGGFPLLAESLLPLVHDPNTSEGREALNLTADQNPELSDVRFARFRVRPGDDASCLNLYRPGNPKIIAADEGFIRSGRFAFQDSLANSKEERENPWLLLNQDLPDGVVPVIGDANSLTYVLHLKPGDELTLNAESVPIRLRVVAALSDSIFQNVLVMAEKHFVRLFPEIQGHQFFLIETSNANSSSAVVTALEDRLSDYGFDVIPANDRLAEFHRVENTYLSTFQLLGGLGLVLGTLGMAAVLLRNVLERRQELALLRAVGYNAIHFTIMVVAENAFLLLCGLVTGTFCALLAVAPVFFGRIGAGPNISLGLLLLSVLISGLTVSLIATLAALRSPLLPALKSE